jgi:hypothetical protein
MIDLIIALLVVGALLYILQYLPIDSTIKRIIQVVAIVVLAIWLLRQFWPMTGLG